MYTQDYDESFPMNSYLNVTNTGPCVATFYWAVTPYVKNDQITVCPSETQAAKVNDLFAPFGLSACANTPPFTSYSVNSALMTNGFLPNATTTALAALPRPSETVMEYDGNIALDGQAQIQVAQARHSETFNQNFADGHSKNVKANRVTAPNATKPQFGTSKILNIWRISAGPYANWSEACGIPQDDNTVQRPAGSCGQTQIYP